MCRTTFLVVLLDTIKFCFIQSRVVYLNRLSLHVSQTFLVYILQGGGCSPVDQLKCGMKLELQDILNPLHVWLVQILENVGGRLYLRLESPQSASKHFWMFYLNPRLHPIGWANEHKCIYKPPQGSFLFFSEEFRRVSTLLFVICGQAIRVFNFKSLASHCEFKSHQGLKIL